jgi:hypothetical protein
VSHLCSIRSPGCYKMVSILAVGASSSVVRGDHALVVKHETTFRTAFQGMLVPCVDEPCVARSRRSMIGSARRGWRAW